MTYSDKQETDSEKKEGEPQNERETFKFWQDWFQAAYHGKNPKRHRKETREAWDEYEKDDNYADERSNLKRSYPVYWSSCKTLEPAYYARQPDPRAKRRFGVKDRDAMNASKIAENLANYMIDGCDFDESITKGVGDFIHADKAATQIIYNGKFSKAQKRLNKSDDEEDKYYNEDGSDYDAEYEIQEDDKGYFYEESSVESQHIYTAPIPYDEIIHNPDAKCQSDITEMGFYFCMSEEEAEERFPDAYPRIKFKSGKKESDESKEYEDKNQMPGKYMDGWEFWCKKTKMLYWVSFNCLSGELLDKKPDPYGLANFFPVTKFIIGSRPSKHLYPTPAYIHLKDTINQLHQAYNKLFKLIDSIRRRALGNAAIQDFEKLITKGDDLEIIWIENLDEIVKKAEGDVRRLLFYIPVDDLVSAISELTSLDEFFNAKFNEFFGVPDILRGVGDPVETARAQAIQAGAAHDRFKWQKSQVQSMVVEAIQMMLDLAFKVFSPEKIWKCAGCDYIFTADQYPSPQEAQAAFFRALEILTDDEERLIRIDIRTDSTSFNDEVADNQNRNAITQTLVGGLDKVQGMLAAGQPEFAAIAMDATITSLEGLHNGDEHIEGFRTRTDSLIQKMMQPPPQQPPPPDYESMKIELGHAKLGLEDSKLQLKKYEIDMKAQAEQTKNMITQMREQFQQELDRRQQAFTEYIQTNYLQVDNYKAQIHGAEKIAEEERLAKEADTAEAATMIEAFKPKEAEKSQPAATINIINAPDNKPTIPLL